MKMPSLKLLILTCLVATQCLVVSFADTIITKEGKEIKGIVVENYTDRVVVSTYEGEKRFLKKDIRKILYDAKGKNFIELGDAYTARREYEKAYFYYEKSLAGDPGDQIARDKMNYVLGYLFRKANKEKQDAVKRRKELEEGIKTGIRAENFEKELEDTMGMRITLDNGAIKISKVFKDSPAEAAGLKEKDIMVSVWGRLTGYMPEEDVARFLVREIPGEVKLGIERTVILKTPGTKGKYNDVIGGELGMRVDGLTIIELVPGGPGMIAGIKKNDLIVNLNGASTRYMPLKEAFEAIEKGRASPIVFTIRRNMTAWRK